MHTIDPTSIQKQLIFEALVVSNSQRIAAIMPVLDITIEYQYEIAKIRHQNYTDLLRPFIDDAKRSLPSPRGLADSMRINIDARIIAMGIVYTRYGISEPAFNDRNEIRYDNQY